MARKEDQIVLEGVKLCCRNFSGTKFGNSETRTFGVLIDEKLARKLEDDGWTAVKWFDGNPDDPQDRPKPWLSVKFKYGVSRKTGQPTGPRINLINSRGKKRLTEDTVDQLDWSWIKEAIVIAHPFAYPAANGRPEGISCWLDALYVTVQEDEFEERFADLRDLDAE